MKIDKPYRLHMTNQRKTLKKKNSDLNISGTVMVMMKQLIIIYRTSEKKRFDWKQLYLIVIKSCKKKKTNRRPCQIPL